MIQVTLQECELGLVTLDDGTVVLRATADAHVFNLPVSLADAERLFRELLEGQHRKVA